MKIFLVVLAVLVVCFVSQCESKAFHFHPFRFDYKKEQTSTGFLKKLSFNGHHGKIFNFNSIYHHGAQASAPIETTTTTTTTTEAPQTPKSTGGHHGFKKHFNINWSYNFNHGPSAANANANVNSNANAVVEAVTALVATTETPFEEEIKIEDFGTNFDTKVDDDSIVEDFHVQDEVVSGNTDHESVNGTDTETGLISNEYLPPKY